ncbi:M28 family metallopeptidase [Tautonia sociabilis]|uniref:M20/M25/M40 family metallo-hydrolase n=1 Tax=Tautonia sociabilis TaxID=2080755 RepID=A0A432MP62_9BACT|nr:M20/M25/M40 family metallo-hydrolase [Tautonia sociabilis]RUL89224.1 M20/M25/M40 family metallo-hydrolase [Tautonia sociabilis]
MTPSSPTAPLLPRSTTTRAGHRPPLAIALAIALAAPVVGDGSAADAPSTAPVSAARIEADLAALVGFGTRHSLSDQNDRAADWLADRFREAGCDDVAFHEFTIGRHTRRNVVATIRGESRPDEFVLVGAHYDSRNEQIADAKNPAPGAVDNASGTAALLELARAIAAIRPGRSVLLVAFSGEEQGLVGSRAYAKTVKDEGRTITLMVNLDMIGHPMDEAGLELVVDRDQGLRRPDNDAASRAWASRLDAHARNAGLVPVPGDMYGSDYMPFEAIGVVCVGLFDGADKAPIYHSQDDTLDQVDPAYCAAATRAALAIIVEAADPGFSLDRSPIDPEQADR